MIQIQEGNRYRIAVKSLVIGKWMFKQDDIILVEQVEGFYCYIKRLSDNSMCKLERLALSMTCERVVD